MTSPPLRRPGAPARPRLCLVEPRHSHEEVLSPLIGALAEDFDLHVHAPRSLLALDLLQAQAGQFRARPFRWEQSAPRLRRAAQLPGLYRRLRREIDEIEPDLVLFNSVHDAADLLFIALAFRGVRKVQVVHDFRLFMRPGLRALYGQFDHNLVLSDDVLDYMCRHHQEFGRLDYYLPLHYEPFRSTGPQSSGEQTGPLELVVLGSTDLRRRNYVGLLDGLGAAGFRDSTAPIRVEFVGRASAQLKAKVAANRLEGCVRLHDAFVPFEEMFATLKRADLLLFLVDETTENVFSYNRLQTSCSSIWARAFEKVCVSSKALKIDKKLEDKCFFYDGSEIAQFLRRVGDGEIGREAIEAKRRRFREDGMPSRELERARLVSLLLRVAGHRPRW